MSDFIKDKPYLPPSVKVVMIDSCGIVVASNQEEYWSETEKEIDI